MRKLIYVPMIHSTEGYNSTHSFENRSAIATPTGTSKKYWDIVSQAITEKTIDNPIVFFEGYTAPGRTIEPINNNGQKRETPEEQVLMQVFEHGGVMESTEDPELFARSQRAYGKLAELYGLFAQIQTEGRLDSMTDAELAKLMEVQTLYDEIPEISDARTEFVAGRIQEALPEGRTGILFMGGNHEVLSLLPEDIETEVLDEGLLELVAELKDENKMSKEGEHTQSFFEGGGETKG